MKKYFRVWKQLANLSISSYFSNRIEYGTYFIGKVIRFGFFWLMVVSIFSHTESVSGYSKYQTILFLLTAFFIDSLSQAFLRGAYDFRNDVKKGTADYLLVKPISPLFVVMLRLTDIIDIAAVTLLLIPIVIIFFKIGIAINYFNIILYALFVLLGLVVVAAIHIMSVALTVWTMESESFIWVYRSSMFAALFPPEIFSGTVQIIFTFILPIIVIVSLPVKVALGLANFQGVAAGLAVAFVIFTGSLLLWRAALKHYSSASS